MQILVVGGGPAGLASARHLLPYLEQRAELSLTVVEKSDQIGGIWNGKPQSPVYRDLHTNLPKELMAFPDLDFEEETKSYVHHSSVSKYLRQYAEKFSLEKFIQFETEVVEVSPVTPGDSRSRWKVRLLCHRTGTSKLTVADLVILTGVREARPRVPDIGSQFGGFQCHSSQYRHPSQEQFVQKKVLIVGGGLSGLDIAVDIASTARAVLISAARGMVPVRKSLGENVIKSRISASRVWFVGGSEAGEDVDSIVWCTGYQKDLGFLSQECGLSISEEGHLVEPLYLHLININYPSMAVMHLNPGNVPFPQMDLQARAFIRLHLEESLPSQERMWSWLRADTQWRESLGLAARHGHKLTGGRLVHWGAYMNQLAASAELQPLPPVLERMFLYSVLLVLLEGLPGARRARFRLNSDKTNFSVSPTSFLLNILYWLLILAIKIGICQ